MKGDILRGRIVSPLYNQLRKTSIFNDSIPSSLIEFNNLLSLPPSGKHFKSVDLVLPCFQLAKKCDMDVKSFSSKLEEICGDDVKGMKLSAAGGYVNIQFDEPYLASQLLPTLSNDPKLPLTLKTGEGRVVCFDYSSPNIAKELGVHHLRSTLIGNSLANIYDANGYNSVRINYIGDWGGGFGKLLAIWDHKNLTLENLNNIEDISKKNEFLDELYREASSLEKRDEDFRLKCKRKNALLEKGEEKSVELWKIFCEVTCSQLKRVYERLNNMEFDSWKGESAHVGAANDIIDELNGKGLLSVGGDSARYFGENEERFVVARSDGVSLYNTRDVGAADDRYNTYGFDRGLYIVDRGQEKHFKQVFKIATALERPYANTLQHVDFGVVLHEAMDDNKAGERRWKKGSSREGRGMKLERLLDAAEEAAYDLTPESFTMEERRRLAQDIGVGGVIFNHLKVHRKHNVKFILKDAISLVGSTGSYVQYTHARLCSILRKGYGSEWGKEITSMKNVDYGLLSSEYEKKIILSLVELQSSIHHSTLQNDPSILCHQLLELSSSISKWIAIGSQNPRARILVEGDNNPTRLARLNLCYVAKHSIANGLSLLGISAPKKM